MKTAAIITIHVGFNFGSVLQTIATSEIIAEVGYKPIIVNYIPDRATDSRYFKDVKYSLPRLIKRILYYPIYLWNKNNVYGGYLGKYVNLSKPIYSKDKFVEVCPEAEVYVTGSDQVWNSIHNEGFDGHYFFDGIPQKKKKIAFSASIGREELDSEELQNIKSHLNRYSAVSVREASAVKILNEIDIHAEHLLDPTLLLNKSQWDRFESPRKIREPYLVIYTPYNIVDEALIYRTARNIAKQYGLKIVTFSTTFKGNLHADKTIKYATPGDFLSLINHADFVITNSFHGTAFAINLNKQFLVYPPSAFSTRIKSILSLTGLTDRLVKEEITPQQLTEIKYEAVNKILDEERHKSKMFLKKALS